MRRDRVERVDTERFDDRRSLHGYCRLVVGIELGHERWSWSLGRRKTAGGGAARERDTEGHELGGPGLIRGGEQVLQSLPETLFKSRKQRERERGRAAPHAIEVLRQENRGTAPHEDGLEEAVTQQQAPIAGKRRRLIVESVIEPQGAAGHADTIGDG